MLIRISPSQKIADCIHTHMHEVACFVVNGHLKFQYGDHEYAIPANEVFFFDPRVPHSFINEEALSTTDFFIAYHTNPKLKPAKQKGRKANPTSFNMALLVNTIREELSPTPDDLISCNALSQLSGVDYNAIAHLLYRNPKDLLLEKIDALCAQTRLPFDALIQKSQNKYKGWIKIYTEEAKTILDYRFYHGMSVATHTGLGTGLRSFGIADLYFEPPAKNEEKRVSWQFTDSCFLGIRVEKGVLGVQYGKQPEVKLSWGDTLYVNAAIPVSFYNPLTFQEAEKLKELKQSAETRITLFSHPPLV